MGTYSQKVGEHPGHSGSSDRDWTQLHNSIRVRDNRGRTVRLPAPDVYLFSWRALHRRGVFRFLRVRHTLFNIGRFLGLHNNSSCSFLPDVQVCIGKIVLLCHVKRVSEYKCKRACHLSSSLSQIVICKINQSIPTGMD